MCLSQEILSRIVTCAVGLLVALGVTMQHLSAQELTIGTKDAPPFAMQDDQGEWYGLSIDLWRDLASDLNLDYRFEQAELQALLQGVQGGQFDAIVAAITVTDEREAVMNFSHPFYSTGWSIAVSDSLVEPLALSLLRGLFSIEFAYALAALAAVLMVAGFLIWLVERSKNDDQFGGSPVKGLGNGFWWAAVTMTTVGYGDKAPITPIGRLIALIWMFASIIIISGFTAAIASSLTVGRLESQISSLSDLNGIRTGVIQDGSGQAYLNDRRIRSVSFPSLEEAIVAMKTGRIDAIFHDTPIIAYIIASAAEPFAELIPIEFGRQDYAIALPEESNYREDINQKILEYINSPERENRETRYLGEEISGG